MIYDFQFKDYLKDVDGMPVEYINSFNVSASNQVEAMLITARTAEQRWMVRGKKE